MDWETLIKIGSALGGTSTLVALYQWAKAQGRAETLAEKMKETLIAKDTEIAELKAENASLWALVNGLTDPQERS